MGKIYEGEVVKVESYGAFVRIPGFQRQVSKGKNVSPFPYEGKSLSPPQITSIKPRISTHPPTHLPIHSPTHTTNRDWCTFPNYAMDEQRGWTT